MWDGRLRGVPGLRGALLGMLQAEVRRKQMTLSGKWGEEMIVLVLGEHDGGGAPSLGGGGLAVWGSDTCSAHQLLSFPESSLSHAAELGFPHGCQDPFCGQCCAELR